MALKILELGKLRRIKGCLHVVESKIGVFEWVDELPMRDYGQQDAFNGAVRIVCTSVIHRFLANQVWPNRIGTTDSPRMLWPPIQGWHQAAEHWKTRCEYSNTYRQRSSVRRVPSGREVPVPEGGLQRTMHSCPLKLLVGRRLAVVLGMQSMPQLSERLVRIRPNAHADIPMVRQRAELVGPGDTSLKGRTLQDIEEII
jgi:hypothetical protein